MEIYYKGKSLAEIAVSVFVAGILLMFLRLLKTDSELELVNLNLEERFMHCDHRIYAGESNISSLVESMLSTSSLS